MEGVHEAEYCQALDRDLGVELCWTEVPLSLYLRRAPLDDREAAEARLAGKTLFVFVQCFFLVLFNKKKTPPF